MPVTQTLGAVLDDQILSDLQALGTSVGITAYSTVNMVPTVTWVSTPTSGDQNAVTSYFQQNNQLRKWT